MCSPAVQFIVLVCSSIGLRHVKTAMYPAGQKKLVVNGIKHENMEKYKNRHEGGYFRNRLFVLLKFSAGIEKCFGMSYPVF